MPNLKSFFTADIYEYDNKRFRIYNEFPNEREFRESVYLDSVEYPGRLLSIERCHASLAWQVQIPDSTGAIYTLSLYTYTATNSLGQSAPLLDDDAEDTLITVPYIQEGFFFSSYSNRFYIVEGNIGKLYSKYSWRCGTFSVDVPNTVYDEHSTVTVEYVRTGQYPEKLWLNETEYLEVYFDYYRDVLTPGAEPIPALNKYTVVYHDEDVQQVEVHKQGSCFDAYTIRVVQSGNVRRVSSFDYIERNIPYELHGPVDTIIEDGETIYKQYYYVKYIDPETDETVWHNTGRFALLKDDREYGEIIPDEQPDDYDRFFIRKIGSTYNAVRYRSTDFASDREAEDYINTTGRYDKFVLVRLTPYLSSTLETLSNGDKVYFYYVDYLDRSYKCDEYEVYEQGGEVTPEPEPDEIDPSDPNLPDPPLEPNAPYQVKPLGNYEIFQSGSDYYAGRWNYKVYYNGAVERLNTFSAVSEALVPQLSSSYTDFPNATPRYKRHYYEVHYDDAEKDVHLSRTLDSYLDVQYFRARFYDYPDSTQLVGWTFADIGTVPELPDGFEQSKQIHGYYCTLYGFTPELAAIYEDTDYRALYADAQTGATHFTIDFYQADETTLIESRQVPVYSPLGALPAAPVKRVTYSSGGKPWGYDIECRDFIDDSRWFAYSANYIIEHDGKAIARYWDTSDENAVYRTFYTVTFKDFRGNDLDFEYYQGDTPEAPAVPARIYSGDDEYEFRGWNPSTIATVNGNAVYTSVYENVSQPAWPDIFIDFASLYNSSYTTIVNKRENAPYGDVTLNDIARFESSSGTLGQTIDGRLAFLWQVGNGNNFWFRDSSRPFFVSAGKSSYMAINVNAGDKIEIYETGSPTFVRVINGNALDESGNAIAENTQYSKNNSSKYIMTAASKGYVLLQFQPWTVINSIAINQPAQAFTIRFLDHAGAVLSSQQVESGTAAQAPQVPSYTSPSAGDISTVFNRYDFSAWNPALLSAETESHDYTAQYTATRVYRLRFYSFSNALVESQFLESGSTVTAPSVPASVESEGTTYNFTGWNPAIASVSANVDYQAVYEEDEGETPVTQDVSIDFPEAYNADGTVISTGASYDNDVSYDISSPGYHAVLSLNRLHGLYTPESQGSVLVSDAKDRIALNYGASRYEYGTDSQGNPLYEYVNEYEWGFETSGSYAGWLQGSGEMAFHVNAGDTVQFEMADIVEVYPTVLTSNALDSGGNAIPQNSQVPKSSSGYVFSFTAASTGYVVVRFYNGQEVYKSTYLRSISITAQS